MLRCAKIKITSRCNLRCVMCKYWQTTSEETLASARWGEVFSELAALGCRKIHFSGGEVFLRRDFLDLVERAILAGMKINMTTNGTLIDKERARRIAKMRVNSVSISLDGPESSSHDAIRGQKRAFKKSVRAIRWLRERSDTLRVRINFVVMNRNYRLVPDMVRLAGSLGADDLVAMPVDEKGKRKLRLTREEILEYNREVAPAVLEARREAGYSVDPQSVYPFGTTDEEVRYSAEAMYAKGFFERRPCLAPWLHLFMAWNGESYLCCMTNGRMESLGNVGRDGVKGVFHGEKFRKVRERFAAGRLLPECQRCDLFLRENAQLHSALDELGQAHRAVGR